jgi:hypothetical protein
VNAPDVVLYVVRYPASRSGLRASKTYGHIVGPSDFYLISLILYLQSDPTYKINHQLNVRQWIILEKSHPGLIWQSSLVPPLQNSKDRVEIQGLECTMTVEIHWYMPCQQTLGAMLINQPGIDFY